MKKREVETYLERYLELKDKIQSEKDHLASLRSIVEKCTTGLSLTAGCNPSKDRGSFENTMLDIVVEEQKADEKIRLYALEMAEIEALISSLPVADERKVLRYRYISGWQTNEIIRKMILSRPQFYRLLNRALDTAAKLKSGLFENETV